MCRTRLATMHNTKTWLSRDVSVRNDQEVSPTRHFWQFVIFIYHVIEFQHEMLNCSKYRLVQYKYFSLPLDILIRYEQMWASSRYLNITRLGDWAWSFSICYSLPPGIFVWNEHNDALFILYGGAITSSNLGMELYHIIDNG